jgi:hypothetical protein
MDFTNCAYLQKVHGHIVLTTIADGIAVDVPDDTAIKRLLDEVDHVLEVIVAFSVLQGGMI